MTSFDTSLLHDLDIVDLDGRPVALVDPHVRATVVEVTRHLR